ncbi:hypothetical protein IT418_04115 [bacterium]|nr:hypothetical protein [bacterium]
MPKISKKSSKKSRLVQSVDVETKKHMVAAVVVVSAAVITPVAWLMWGSVLLLFLIPTIGSLLAALLFKQITGRAMTQEFRRETTSITAVFAVILSVLASLNLPRIGLDGQADTVLPIFMIFYMSLWAIAGVLVTVYLPLGITIPRKK